VQAEGHETHKCAQSVSAALSVTIKSATIGVTSGAALKAATQRLEPWGS
jgi:hypothetical protein